MEERRGGEENIGDNKERKEEKEKRSRRGESIGLAFTDWNPATCI